MNAGRMNSGNKCVGGRGRQVNANKDERLRTSGGWKENGRSGETRGETWPGSSAKRLETWAWGNRGANRDTSMFSSRMNEVMMKECDMLFLEHIKETFTIKK